MALRLRDRVLFGLVLPLAILVGGMLFIANLPSKAGAAEFAGLGVFFMLLWSLPMTILANIILIAGDVKSRASCFKLGMIMPGIVFLAAIVYQSGLWDLLT